MDTESNPETWDIEELIKKVQDENTEHNTGRYSDPPNSHRDSISGNATIRSDQPDIDLHGN